MSFISNLFSGGVGQVVDSIGKVIDSVTTTKEEKQQLDNEIRKSEMQYNLEIRKIDLEEKQAVLKDVDSARTMASNIQTSSNATSLSKNVAAYLALGTVFLTFVLFFVWAFAEVTQSQKEIVLYILGVLSAIDTRIFSFYFGSSQGSKDKQATLDSNSLANK